MNTSNISKIGTNEIRLFEGLEINRDNYEFELIDEKISLPLTFNKIVHISFQNNNHSTLIITTQYEHNLLIGDPIYLSGSTKWSHYGGKVPYVVCLTPSNDVFHARMVLRTTSDVRTTPEQILSAATTPLLIPIPNSSLESIPESFNPTMVIYTPPLDCKSLAKICSNRSRNYTIDYKNGTYSIISKTSGDVVKTINRLLPSENFNQYYRCRIDPKDYTVINDMTIFTYYLEKALNPILIRHHTIFTIYDCTNERTIELKEGEYTIVSFTQHLDDVINNNMLYKKINVNYNETTGRYEFYRHSFPFSLRFTDKSAELLGFLPIRYPNGFSFESTCQVYPLVNSARTTITPINRYKVEYRMGMIAIIPISKSEYYHTKLNIMKYDDEVVPFKTNETQSLLSIILNMTQYDSICSMISTSNVSSLVGPPKMLFLRIVGDDRFSLLSPTGEMVHYSFVLMYNPLKNGYELPKESHTIIEINDIRSHIMMDIVDCFGNIYNPNGSEQIFSLSFITSKNIIE